MLSLNKKEKQIISHIHLYRIFVSWYLLWYLYLIEIRTVAGMKRMENHNLIKSPIVMTFFFNECKLARIVKVVSENMLLNAQNVFKYRCVR